MRAVAVVAVVLYHLWPNRLPGGYVGVDVFFVISGFLITSHLLSRPPQRGRDLLEFWSRRIRRLLPASLLVLLVTLVATRLVAPDTLWANTARYVRAAALYGVNWRMASDSVDYLAANNAPTPVQHFWSLSVEEQFYLVWPILIAALVLIARRHAWAAITFGLGAVTVVSFWYSVHETTANPGAAYFITPTRVWELGVGGVLAAVVARGRTRTPTPTRGLPSPARVVLSWTGLAAIAWTLFAFSDKTSFPSWHAAIPVLGAAAVIGADARRGPASPIRLMAWRPIQWLGDVSYSIYLWHWPLLVLLPYESGGHLGRLDKFAVVVATLVLAELTKRYIEDRFRTPNWGRPLLKPYALGATAMALVVGASLLQTTEISDRTAAANEAVGRQLASGNPCFGAAALGAKPGQCPVKDSGALSPNPAAAAADKSDAWDSADGKDCFAHPQAFELRSCVALLGGQGRISVALIGNSHAGQWYGALKAVAAQEHWNVTTFIASQCAVADMQQHFVPASESDACRAWGRSVVRAVTQQHFDLVVMANRVSVTAAGQPGIAASAPVYEAGYETVLRELTAAGRRVAVLRDTPAPGASIPDCLAAHTSDYSACDGSRSKWLPPDPAVDAARALNNRKITVVDLTDHICGAAVCGAEVGGVPVYFDGSHLTRAYALTLAPYLRQALVAALKAD